MKKRFLISGCVALLLMLTGCDVVTERVTAWSRNMPDAQPANTIDTALYEQGIEIYLEAYCGSCHQLSAAETRGAFGPSHDAAATLAAERLTDSNYDGEATTPAGYIRESIINPQVYFTPTYAGAAHRMPAYTNLTEAELDAVVYMLMQQREDD